MHKPAQTIGAGLSAIRKTIPAGLVFTSLLMGTCSTSLAAAVKLDSLEALDKRFQQFSRDFYSQTDKQANLSLAKFKTVTGLKNKVDEYIKSGKAVEAIALIHHNHDILTTNIDAVEIIPLTALLLEHNDWYEAKRIYDIAKVEAGKSATSNISFEFAKYFMQRKKWQEAYQYLNDVINELSVENANYAHLMIGTILQHQKKHRQAVDYYKKITTSSMYYSTAVLNTAVAYIRQDWWTDALLIINKTIDDKTNPVTNEMADRLNLLLGYALLRKEYFRNSREAFRKIRLDSPYTNKALLGIALTAANQDDFIGALNAITLLKEKKTTDLSVDESFLLLPYTYGKLKQYLTASSAYTDAIKYYQERIAGLEDANNMGNGLLSIVKISTQTDTLHIKSNDFDYARQYPESFFDNYVQLMQFKVLTGSTPELGRQYDKLLSDYRDALKNITLQLVSQRIDYLQSYLNQSRYGLARLYDSSLISAN